MKKHFIALFDAEHRRTTFRFAILSLFLSTFSIFVGFQDNVYGNVLLYSSLSCLLYVFVHPWKRGRNYAIMAGISIVIILVIYGLIRFLTATGYEQMVDKGLLIWLTSLICIPGIIVGVIGSIIYGEKATQPEIKIPVQ